MPRAVRQHLAKRPDGRFRCKFKGKEFYGRTEDEALDLRKEYIASLERGSITRCSVTDYALPWLKRAYPAVKDSTKSGLAIHMQHLIDNIGNTDIADVKPSDIKHVYATCYAGLSNTYIQAAKQLYCSLFDAALADGLIRFNPARDKSARPHRGRKVKERELSPDKRHLITSLCVNHRAWPAVMTMLYAGLRPQEVKALNIDRDVDFERGIITVREQVHVEGQNYAISGELKSEWSSRSIPLFPPLKSALEGRHGMLVTSASGGQVTIQAWKVLWKSYICAMETAINGCPKRWYGKKREHRGIDLPPWKDFSIVPYTLRHAFCQMCRDSEVDINTCRRWMGHADTKMILSVYDSVSSDRFVNESKKVVARLGVNAGVTET